MSQFDYVIVGAGTAGCVLANRLTAHPAIRVLLLEAGGTARVNAIRIPAAFPTNFRSQRDWAFETEPQPNLGGRRMFQPRGKVLGGSSSINAMVYMRGHPHDYDGWANQGCTGWSYKEVLPYFRKAEREQRFGGECHGRDGPLSVEAQRHVNQWSSDFVEAGRVAGLDRRDDFNGGTPDGVGIHAVMQQRGERESAATAYLNPVRGRANLQVETGSHVLGLSYEGRRVTGLSYQQDGRVIEARAQREVLLCAGAFQSPQLLMLSGIGPPEELSRHGIPIVHDSPDIGRNLQDHLLTPLAYRAREQHGLDPGLGSLVRWMLFRTGPLTSNIAEAGMFFRSRADLPAPDLQMLFGPVFFLHHGFTRPEGHGFTLGPVLLTPKSRGRITLRSSDPTAPPRIDPNYLSDESDRQTMIAGMRLARRIASTEPLARHAAYEHLPGPKCETDDEFLASLALEAETCYHPVGTCRMGVDSTAVVDPSLRVNGVTGLRVVDASIMPAIVRGNTTAPTIMIAEKAADLIRGLPPLPRAAAKGGHSD
jgi:choline dehydrogenase